MAKPISMTAPAVAIRNLRPGYDDLKKSGSAGDNFDTPWDNAYSNSTTMARPATGFRARLDLLTED